MSSPKWERVKFLKDAPVIVGPDLEEYGPFEKGDLAYLPSQNASILVKQKVAELAREVLEKPSLKQMFKGEVLTPFQEAAKSKLLTEFNEEKEKKRLIEVLAQERLRDDLIKRTEKILKETREAKQGGV